MSDIKSAFNEIGLKKTYILKVTTINFKNTNLKATVIKKETIKHGPEAKTHLFLIIKMIFSNGSSF